LNKNGSLTSSNQNFDHYLRVKADFDRRWFAKFESVLDGASCGPLWLKDERLAESVADSLHYRDGTVFRLDAFTIMPNHAHVVFKPLPIENDAYSELDDDRSLALIMQSLKGFTAHECNRLLRREGQFWAHESFDYYIRDVDEWQRIIAYVLNNPVKAGYVKHWQDWKWSYRRVAQRANLGTKI
jgi:putative transposase